jgi:hypothetical protein
MASPVFNPDISGGANTGAPGASGLGASRKSARQKYFLWGVLEVPFHAMKIMVLVNPIVV